MRQHLGPAGSYESARAAREYIAARPMSLWDTLPDDRFDGVQDAEEVGTGPDGNPIFVVGGGPRTCTSARTVAHLRPVRVYDVNGYYAALGVDPGATLSDLSRAYAALGGHQDPWLTEALMILRDPAKRAAYDAMLPFQRFGDSSIERARLREYSLRFLREYDPDDPRMGTILEESLYAAAHGTQEYESAYTSPSDPPTWGYAHYLWGVFHNPAAVTGLQDWQQLVVAALDDDGGQPLHFGVGRCALPQAVGMIVAGIPVAFAPTGTPPDPTQAAWAASQLRQAHRRQIESPHTHTPSHANRHHGSGEHSP